VQLTKEFLSDFLPQLPSTLRNHPSIKNAISQIKTLSAHRTSGNQESVNAQSSRPSTTVDDPIVINNLEEQQRLSSTNYRNQSGQECRTAPCVISASNMERLIDWKAEPCDDFYDFACGSFVRDSTLHDRRDSLNAFSMTNDKLKDQLRRLFTRKSQPDEIEPYRLVKDLYSSCTDTDAHDAVGIGPLRELILATGGWPMLDDSKWSESNWDLERAILQLRTVIGHQNINIFRTLSVGLPSFKQAAAASSGGQSMNASVTLEYVDKINAIFRSYLTDIASLMGADKRRIEAQLDDAIEFQNNLIKLNSHYENAVINTARLPTINGFGRNELHVKHSLMRWMDLLNPLPLKLFAASTSSTEAVNDARAFWKAFEELLAKTSKRTLANYFVIRIIGFAAPHMTTDIKKRALHYQMLFLGIKKREETWKECVDVVSDLLQLAVEAMFSKEYFDLESKAFAIDMARRIKETYVKQLSTISWLSQREKAEALLKIDRRIAELSFPTELLSDRQIKIIYRNLKVQPQNYLESIFGISIFNADRRFLLMQTGLKLGSSSDSAGLLNSVDVKKNNKILYPSGVLQREVVSPDRPNYLNYASSGFVIGYIFSQSFEVSFFVTHTAVAAAMTALFFSISFP